QGLQEMTLSGEVWFLGKLAVPDCHGRRIGWRINEEILITGMNYSGWARETRFDVEPRPPRLADEVVELIVGFPIAIEISGVVDVRVGDLNVVKHPLWVRSSVAFAVVAFLPGFACIAAGAAVFR